MFVCPNCAKAIDAKAEFCPYCDVQFAGEYVELIDSSGIDAPPDQSSTLMKRYKDAYIVARVTNGFGGVIKAIGVIIGGLLAVGGFVVASNGGPRDPMSALGIVGIVVGVIAGALFYIIGVLVSAQAQILKASLDSAVNTSPFLTNEHRATIMSLPRT